MYRRSNGVTNKMNYNIINTNVFIDKQIWTDQFLNKFYIEGERQNELEIRGLISKKNSGNIQLYEGLNRYSTVLRFNLDVMFVDFDQKRGNIMLPFFNQTSIKTLILQLFFSNILKKKVLQFHASLIQINSAGLMFLGPSGIGKTTQAELWNQYRDALIINGDVVFVQETESAFLGWGTPWHGSSLYCENTNVPVYAMIVLKQTSKNSIRELTGFEKATTISNNMFYPRWMENGIELCLDTLDHLLTKIPVYELSCRPDEDAVRMTEKVVFGKNGILL